MMSKSKTNLLKTMEGISNKYNSLPPYIQKAITEIRNFNFRNNFLKVESFLNTSRSNAKIRYQERRLKKMTEKEKKEQVEEAIDLQVFRPTNNFKCRLDEVYQDQIVIVEFCCCGFLKKAIGCLALIGADFIELVGVRGGIVPIDIFFPNGAKETEDQGFRVIIPIEKICAVELISKPPCPPCDPYPPYPPKRPYSGEEE